MFDPDNEDQWVDECVLWAGEPEQFDQFSNFELFKLDSLARILDQPMPSFASASFPASTSGDLGMPNTFDVLQSSGSLFIGGFELAESGLTLFIQGISAGTTFEKIVDTFLRTADFHPTIIGSFTPPTSGVTIAVWDVIDGVNIQLTILDAISFPIGDTGRFGWSTEKLPITNRNTGQFIFQMTDSVGETFVGEFFLDSPESRLS